MHRRAIILLLSIAAVSFASSCLKEDAFITQTDEMEGVPTMLTLSVNMNEMQGLTRAAMSDANANRVNSLWVGIYNASTGNCTYNNIFTREQIGNPGNHELATLPAISTKSGVSYIVAVANAEDNYGITDNADLKESAGLADTRGGELSALLAKADTWEKYKSISLMLTDPSNVDFSGSNNLAMSGSYYKKKDADPVSWYDGNGNPETVYISSNEAELSGCIHLRRMISYIKFNIAAGENITIEPVSWKVFNTPIIAYLQEQTANSADVSSYFTGRPGYATNHGESNLSYDFTHGSFTKATGEQITGINGAVEGDSFDFYQFENKQTAIDFKDLGGDDYIGINENSQSPYSDREREWKKGDDGSNTGVYKSLSRSAENADKNNYATYVTFRLKVTYWVILDEANVGTETPVAPGTEGAIRREGYADYTVHLGYIEGNGNLEKARDFNCRRNMKYTYNVTVNSLNSIIVEAFTNSENQPGAEGDVTDVRNTGRIELDSHYAVFNIELSYAERAALKWMIDAPYNDVSYSYYADDYRTGGVHAGYDLNNDQFYTWIRFKPTTDATTLRVYNDGGTDGIGWTLEELADPANHQGVDADGNNVAYDETSTEQLWYTVFIDEYVYHKDEHGNSTDVEDGDRGTVEGNWWAYVNQEPRIVWIAYNNRHVSDDRESMYLNSKYMISQNSILTYYSSDVQTPNNTALGMERENETFGLNLAWSQTAWNALGTANADNGRYNVWYYLSGGNTSNTTSTDGRGWSSVAKIQTKRIAGNNVNCCEQFTRDAINTVQLTETESKTARVFMPAAINGNIYTVDRKDNNDDTYNPDPDGLHYEVLTACMSRNRDENGNGIIDAGEMKWYVPTTGKYARIILGRAVIPQSQRLMNFDITPVYGFDGNNVSSDNNTRFHFASSDKKVVWAEEGTSTSDWYQGDWEFGAWEVRCVRNLGVNMGRVIDNDPVTPAYTYENNIFTLAYYEDGCKRAPQSTHLPAHDVQSSINQPAYQFEVAKERCNSTNTTGIDADSGLTLTANGALNGYSATAWKEACDNNYICGRYSQETGGADLGSWRVPNQKEMVMMRRQGLLTGNNNADGYFSCTQEHFTKTGNTEEKRFFMFFPNRGTINSGLESGGSYHVRCVRDVMNN